MHDAGCMRRVEADAHVRGQLDDGLEIELSILTQQAREILPVEQLHREVRRAALELADLVHLDDVG